MIYVNKGTECAVEVAADGVRELNHPLKRRSAMRKMALLAAGLLLGVAACDEPATTAPEPAPDGFELSSSMHAPGAPVVLPFGPFVFPDDDPCTPTFDPNEHIVTISGTLFVHFLPNGNLVARVKRTITTDSGYEGRGEATQVVNGNVFQLQLNDINSHPDGRKFRSNEVLIIDLTTDPPTVRVAEVGLTCIRS